MQKLALRWKTGGVKIGFVPTGKGTHGLYASRDSQVLYISNRGEGSVSVREHHGADAGSAGRSGHGSKCSRCWLWGLPPIDSLR